MYDLEAAISKAGLAVSATPEDYPDRAAWLYNLEVYLSHQYNRKGNMHDLTVVLKAFMISFNLLNTLPPTRIRAARRAICILVSMENWDQAYSFAEVAIKLLPSVCGRYLSRDDQQYAILQISSLAADACSL